LTVEFADRVHRMPVYHFAEVEREVAERRGRGIEVINLGIGDPDMPTPFPVREMLKKAVDDPTTHTYPTNRGTRDFRDAVAGFYRERFDVAVDAETEVLPVLGSKEGLAHLCLVMLQPGDVALALDPGYPVYVTGPLIAGAEVVRVPLRPDRGFQPDLDAIDEGVLARAKVIFAGYPHNPTGAVVEDDLFERLVALAELHGLLVVHDHAYAEITFDGYIAPSFLQTPGAKRVGVELYSLSKGFNMTGWRSAALVGSADVVNAYWKLKTNIDSGMFTAVQCATVEALAGWRDTTLRMRTIYQRRRNLLVSALRRAGLDAPLPRGTIYLWVPVPEGHSSASLTRLFLEQADVVVSAGTAYGPRGEGFIRFSLSAPDDALEEAARRIQCHVRL
jgi:LL-diaminopimelate aminotransferase